MPALISVGLLIIKPAECCMSWLRSRITAWWKRGSAIVLSATSNMPGRGASCFGPAKQGDEQRRTKSPIKTRAGPDERLTQFMAETSLQAVGIF